MKYLAFRSNHKELSDLVGILLQRGYTIFDNLNDYHRYNYLYVNTVTRKIFYASPTIVNSDNTLVIEDVESSLIIIQLGGIDLLVQSLGVQS